MKKVSNGSFFDAFIITSRRELTYSETLRTNKKKKRGNFGRKGTSKTSRNFVTIKCKDLGEITAEPAKFTLCLPDGVTSIGSADDIRNIVVASHVNDVEINVNEAGMLDDH